MQRCLAALGVVLALVLAAGFGTARAGDPAQTLSQTQSATNSVDQNAQAGALSVNASPNVAVLNAGSVDQSSTSSADATAANENNHSTQTVDQSQSADQTTADSFCCGRYLDGQSTEQSQSASNSVDQNAQAGAVSVNASPNVAVLNKGDVTQSSSSDASGKASNTNSSTQSIEQSQTAAQRTAGDSHCCRGGDRQSVDQDQDASNSVDQNARAGALSVNASPNVALLNKGHVTQSSSSGASSTATNRNSSSQSIDQSQSATQRSLGGRCCKRGSGQDADQSQDASNSVSQDARATAISVNASPNVAALNWGSVNQSSGSHASATATNTSSSTQSIEQNQRSLQSDSAGRHHRHHVKHHRHHRTWGACSA